MKLEVDIVRENKAVFFINSWFGPSLEHRTATASKLSLGRVRRAR